MAGHGPSSFPTRWAANMQTLPMPHRARYGVVNHAKEPGHKIAQDTSNSCNSRVVSLSESHWRKRAWATKPSPLRLAGMRPQWSLFRASQGRLRNTFCDAIWQFQHLARHPDYFLLAQRYMNATRWRYERTRHRVQLPTSALGSQESGQSRTQAEPQLVV